MIARFRGRVGQSLDPEFPEYRGKWFFEILVTDIDLKHGEGKSVGQFGPFDTEEKAKKELETAMKLCVEDYETRVFGKTSGRFWDMNDHEKLKKWK